jgi:hypothetical protein
MILFFFPEYFMYTYMSTYYRVAVVDIASLMCDHYIGWHLSYCSSSHTAETSQSGGFPHSLYDFAAVSLSPQLTE